MVVGVVITTVEVVAKIEVTMAADFEMVTMVVDASRAAVVVTYASVVTVIVVKILV